MSASLNGFECICGPRIQFYIGRTTFEAILPQKLYRNALKNRFPNGQELKRSKQGLHGLAIWPGVSFRWRRQAKCSRLPAPLQGTLQWYLSPWVLRIPAPTRSLQNSYGWLRQSRP